MENLFFQVLAVTAALNPMVSEAALESHLCPAIISIM